MPSRLPVILLVEVAALLGLTGGQTVGATFRVDRDLPTPEECRLAPRSVASVLAFTVLPLPHAATPGAAMPAPTSTPMPPDGRPVDAATLAAITRTAREWIACRNAGDLLRQLALFSDDGLTRFIATYGPPPGTQELALGGATPLASPRPPEARIAFVMVRDARMQSDGRIHAVIVEDRPGEPLLENTAQVVFIHQGDRWLIDELVFQDAAPASG